MSTNNEEMEELKQRNNELVKSLEHWKITAAQRDREKFSLIRERNELKLKLNRIRSGGAAQIRQLDAALQAAIQETLTHLVQASNAVARTMELAKTYMRDRQELDASSPRWSRLSGTPPAERERVNRVPPMLIGGQSIQPVVSLSRTLLNSSNSPSRNRSPSQQSRNVTQRPVPMHILQDVYIPLTRIDAAELQSNQMEDGADDIDNSTEDLGLEDSSEQVFEESQNVSDIAEFEDPQVLQTVIEEEEPEVDQSPSPTASGSCIDNPLEGPSWLLDTNEMQTSRTQGRVTLEPDSTTELEEAETRTSLSTTRETQVDQLSPAAVRSAFTPTVRRHKRTSSPHLPPPRRNSINKRVLKVVIAKMKFDDENCTNMVSPPKKMKTHTSPGRSPILQSVHLNTARGIPGPKVQEHSEQLDVESPILQVKDRLRSTTDSTKNMMRFHAPSPNGATDARVIIVSETKAAAYGSGEISVGTQPASRSNRHNSARSNVSDSPRDTTNTDTSLDIHVTRRDTNKARRDTSASRRDTGASRRDTITSLQDTRTSRHDTITSRQDTSASRRDTITSRQDTSASRRDTSASRRDTDDTRFNTNNENRRDHDSRSVTPESDSGLDRQEGRSRRPRKQVTYREKPLKGKLRR